MTREVVLVTLKDAEKERGVLLDAKTGTWLFTGSLVDCKLTSENRGWQKVASYPKEFVEE